MPIKVGVDQVKILGTHLIIRPCSPLDDVAIALLSKASESVSRVDSGSGFVLSLLMLFIVTIFISK